MARAPLDPLADLRPAPKADLVVQPVDAELVVYDPGADQLHRLEPSAAAVWTRLSGDLSWSAVSCDIAAAYGLPEEVADRDIAMLADMLHNRGLLEGSTGVSTPARRSTATTAELEFDVEPRLPPARHVTRRFDGLKYAFRIATNEPRVQAYLDETLADLACSDGDTTTYHLIALAEDRYVLRCDGETIVATGRLDRALAVLLWHINAEVIRWSTPHYPLVHAAAGVRDSMAVLLPAAPGGGKTTTVAGLVSRAGFGYLTDEAVAIDPATLMPEAYPKPLSIDRGSWSVLEHLRPTSDLVTGQWQVPARSIMPGAVAEPAPIRYIVEPAYDPDADTGVETVSRAAMLVRLADSTFNFADAPERNLQVLAGVVEDAGCYRLPISDLDEAVRLISKMLSGAATTV